MIVNLVGTAIVVAIAIAIGLYIDKKLGVKPENLESRNIKGNIEVRINREQSLRKRGNVQVDLDRRGPRVGPAAGETPATAIRAGVVQLANLRSGQRCRECRALLEADGPDEELRYADRPLLLLQFRCPTCVRKRSLYVVPTA